MQEKEHIEVLTRGGSMEKSSTFGKIVKPLELTTLLFF